MLKNMTKGACVLAAALTFGASVATADDGDGITGVNHVIEIVDGAYLPIISYVNPGDHLVFRNETDSTKTVSGPNESWTSGPISPGAQFLLQLEEETPMSFGGDDVEGIQIAGEYTYEPAPTTD